MGNLQVSKEEMLKRVARFKQVAPSEYAFVDSKIPGHERLIYNVIGGGVTEDPSHTPAIQDARDFNVTFVKAEPGKGAALHSRTTVEVFTPLSGRWAIIWADPFGENELTLKTWNTISVPPGVMRAAFTTRAATMPLMAILGGTDAGRCDVAAGGGGAGESEADGAQTRRRRQRHKTESRDVEARSRFLAPVADSVIDEMERAQVVNWRKRDDV